MWSLRLPDLNVSGEVHGRREFLYDRAFGRHGFPVGNSNHPKGKGKKRSGNKLP